jgi:predicted nuclease with TOPRIM domain
MLKIYALLIVVGLVGGVVYAGKYYYDTTQAQITTLTENNTKLEGAVETAEAATESLKQDYAKIAKELNKVNNEFARIRKQNNVLADKLKDERAINTGTINAGRCFEILSGSELTEKELGAKNGKEFNKECPWLWPGNTITE